MDTLYGKSISSEREDDLDRMALDSIAGRSGIKAMDLCCGQGGMAKKLNPLCSLVLAIDLRPGISSAGTLFSLRQDIRKPFRVPFLPFDLIVFQRAIHYLSWQDATRLLLRMKGWIKKEGCLYISASGIESELGTEYQGKGIPIEKRMAHLSPEMMEKHEIMEPVCLYSMDEFRKLLESTGWTVKRSFTSPFGNLKAVAHVS